MWRVVAAAGLLLGMLWLPPSALAADPRAPTDGARLTDAATSVTNTATVVSWDTEVTDDAGYFTSSSATRLTVPRAGWCLFGGTAKWSADSGSGRWFWMRLNGSGVVAEVSSHADTAHNDPWQTVSAGYLLTAGDYIEFLLQQNDGAAGIAVGSLKAWIACDGPTVTPAPGGTGPPGADGAVGPTGPPGEACPTPMSSAEADCVVEVSSFTGSALDALQLQTFTLVIGWGLGLLCLAWIAISGMRR